MKVTHETDSEEEEEEEGEEAKEMPPPSVPPPDKPSNQPNTSKSAKYKPAATVSLITKHTNGTLNLWNVMFADKSKFGNLLNISHRREFVFATFILPSALCIFKHFYAKKLHHVHELFAIS